VDPNGDKSSNDFLVTGENVDVLWNGALILTPCIFMSRVPEKPWYRRRKFKVLGTCGSTSSTHVTQSPLTPFFV